MTYGTNPADGRKTHPNGKQGKVKGAVGEMAGGCEARIPGVWLGPGFAVVYFLRRSAKPARPLTTKSSDAGSGTELNEYGPATLPFASSASR